jgi:hypothetical protein
MLYFDIETEVCHDAIQFMDEPTAPSNYKDPEKIAAYIAEKRQEQIEKAPLDADYGQIVAIGVKSDAGDTTALLARDDSDERTIINLFWKYYANANGVSCGYNIIGFDLPYLMRRSFALGIKPAVIPSLAKYRYHPTLDLMMVLYNWQGFKGLKWVAKRYGLDNPLPDLEGSQVATMDNKTLRAYVINDVELVYQLWERMRGVYF